METIISLKAIITASAFASQDATRPYLCSVAIDTRGEDNVPEYWATDGHIMCNPRPNPTKIKETAFDKVVELPAIEEAIMLPLGVVKDLKPLLGKNEDVLMYLRKTGEDQFEFATFDGQRSIKFKSQNGSYPDVRRIIPQVSTEASTADIGFDVDFLARFKPVAKAYNKRRSGLVKINISGHTNPARFEFSNPDNGESCLIVISPMRYK